MSLCNFRLAAAIGAAMTYGAISTAQAVAQPVALAGYGVAVFATPPAGVSAPDSIAVYGSTIWIAYGNGVPPDGSSGSSTIIAYSLTGEVMRTLTVAGHSDGLRLDPNTGMLWAMQNEDAKPTLVLIDPRNGSQTAPMSLSPVNGGGYDDVAFIGGRTYISASNPALNGSGVNTSPAMVEVQPSPSGLKYSNALSGNAPAFNPVTGLPVRLNLTDPDSLIPTPGGDLLLDDQGDGQLILVHVTTTTGPRVQQIPLLGGVQVDDTVFATARVGALYVSDTKANTVYVLRSRRFEPGRPYSASTGVGTTVPAYVGKLFLDSGALVPILTGLTNPHGMAFRAITP